MKTNKLQNWKEIEREFEKTVEAIPDEATPDEIENTFKSFLKAKLSQQKQEINNMLRNLMAEFSNTPIDKRGNGWDWLKKAKENL